MGIDQGVYPVASVRRFDSWASAPREEMADDDRMSASSSITRTFTIGGPQPLGGVDPSLLQPMLPSISISIKRLSSTAYSRGNCFAIGSMKPRTMSAIASSSLMPRLIR